MKTENPIPPYAIPERGFRSYAAAITPLGNVMRTLRAHHAGRPSAMARYWLQTFGYCITANNRALRHLIFTKWGSGMPPGGKMSWKAASVILGYYNYKWKQSTKKGFVLFVRHHVYKASESFWDDFPQFMHTFSFQNFAPNPYTLPPTPVIDHIDPLTGTQIHLVTKNVPANLFLPDGSLIGTTIILKQQSTTPPNATPCRGYMGFPWYGGQIPADPTTADIFIWLQLPYYYFRKGRTFAIGFRYTDPLTFIRSDPQWFSATAVG